MPLRHLGSPLMQGQFLMDVAGVLADYTQRLPLCRQVPAYLSRVLNLETLSLTVVRDQSPVPAQILLNAGSGILAERQLSQPATTELLTIYSRYKRATSHPEPTLRSTSEYGTAPSSEGIVHVLFEHFGVYTRSSVIFRVLDEHHSLMLIVHDRVDAAAISKETLTLLELIANQLAKLMGCLMAWTQGTEEIGVPFDRLTQREWMVLRGLDSDAGEKQLADELGLSPHTLHSHIKSIYRKVGVQGRLPLLLKAEEARRTLRTSRINTPLKRIPQNGTPISVCA